MGVPKELNEAAAIDGAGPIRTFISIMLPMAKSTLASLAIIVFTYSWNDYFTTFIMINDTEKLTLPVGILSIKQPFSTGDNVVFAAVVLAILPVLIVFLIGQKWIVKKENGTNCPFPGQLKISQSNNCPLAPTAMFPVPIPPRRNFATFASP